MDTDRLSYTQKRKEYKELLWVKKTAHRQKVLDALHKAKNDPKAIWENGSHVCQKNMQQVQLAKRNGAGSLIFFFFFLKCRWVYFKQSLNVTGQENYFKCKKVPDAWWWSPQWVCMGKDQCDDKIYVQVLNISFK